VKVKELIEEPMIKVFLGGTWNDSTWRSDLISMLKCDFFNPVVEDWTPECIENEYREKNSSDYQLFVLTPEMTGCFSVAEFIDASNKIPGRTMVAIPLLGTGRKSQRNDGQLMLAWIWLKETVLIFLKVLGKLRHF